MNLEDYRNRLNPDLTKEGLFEELDLANSVLAMIDGIYPKWSEALESVPKDYPELQTPKFINHMAKTCTKKNLALSTQSRKKTVRDNLDILQKSITTEFPDDFSPLGANARQLQLLILLEIATTYSKNLVMMMVQSLRAAVRHTEPDDEDYATDKKAMRVIDDTRTIMVTVIDVLQKKPDQYKALITKVPDVVVNAANQSILSSKLGANSGFLAVHKSKGFNGSPILWLRQSFMGLFEDRYTELDDEKRYLELLLIQAENKKKGQNSPAIQAEIDRIEERIASLNYRMDKILEESGDE